MSNITSSRKINFRVLIMCLLACLPGLAQAQTVADDFEGNGTITTWFGDDCGLNISRANPHMLGINTSATVLEYHDQGGQYANVRFDVPTNFDLSAQHTFSIKIYVPTSGLTGNAPNQVSLKLQDGTLGSPWSTQSEIIKPILLNQWQTVTFNFLTDTYANLDPTSLPPTQRTDFNRVLIQVNGENNTDHVLAFIDDVLYDGTLPAAPNFNQLVWADEFNGSGQIDTSKWFHQTQLPQGGSWYNGEIQHYTNRIDNSYVTNGALHIAAKKETFTDQGFTKTHTSARLNSKFAFTYGRVEVRAILPTGVGTWPAIWMLGKNINEDGAFWDLQGFGTTPWPACGEIDIMEHWGNNQNYVQSAMHTPSSFGGTVNKGGQNVPTASTAYHVYALEWSPTKMVFSVDGVVHYTYNPAVKDASTWPFAADQYLLLNIAIEPSISANFTQSEMIIDYVRVYQEGAIGVLEFEEKQPILAYPNPVADRFTVALKQAPDQTATLRIYTLQGQLARQETGTLENGKISITNLDGLKKGVYFLMIELDGASYPVKFSKE
jgi:beta-glucanase (GH16 family)